MQRAPRSTDFQARPRLRYEVQFEPSMNSFSDVAVTLCTQKAEDISLVTEDEIKQCVALIENSLAAFNITTPETASPW